MYQMELCNKRDRNPLNIANLYLTTFQDELNELLQYKDDTNQTKYHITHYTMNNDSYLDIDWYTIDNIT